VFTPEAFTLDAAGDELTCPAGQTKSRRDRNGNATDTDNGVFTFTAGNVNVNTLIVGDQASASTGCVATGTLNVNGANAFLTVNNTLALGQTTLTVSPATSASGVLNIINGTVNASNITVGAVSVNNIITMTNATLIVTNSLATNASGLFALTMSNSFLGLTVAASGSRAALVQPPLATATKAKRRAALKERNNFMIEG